MDFVRFASTYSSAILLMFCIHEESLFEPDGGITISLNGNKFFLLIVLKDKFFKKENVYLIRLNSKGNKK